METTFIPIDYDYFDYEGRNYAKIFGRNKEGKRICVIDSCEVYLWAILKEDVSVEARDSLIQKISKIQLDLKGRKTKVEKVELHEKNFLEKKVKALKIFATNYKDLHDVASELDFEEIEKRRGHDLGYITHYIIEKKLYPLNTYKIEGEILEESKEFNGIGLDLDVDYCIKLEKIKETESLEFKPKTLAYDIETDELEIGKGEILMISLVGENYKKVITWKPDYSKNDSYPHYVEKVKDESELIKRFCQCVKEFSPDFLVGYFSDGFDLPYIKARANKHRIKIPLGLDGSQPKISRGLNLTAKIKGIVHIDILKFIKTAYAQYMQSETLTLNDVANEFLGEAKTDFKLKHSSKIKDDEWEKYYEYNLQDSVLTLRLFEKFLPDLLEFTKTVKEPIFEMSRNGLSKYVENYLLHNLERFNEIPEKRPGFNDIKDRKEIGAVEGAFVFQPTPGLYENIAIFDFTSMHTSIIITQNLSRETLVSEKEKDSTETPEIEIFGKKIKYYFTKNPGFFPTLLKELFEKRKKFKQEYKKNPNPITKARSNAFKVLSASAHGYLGFFGARYYSREASSSVLAFVREFNKQTIEKVQKEGFKVIFSDTDSVGFLMENKTKEEIKEFLKKLNSELPGVMELELEGFFKRGLWVSKRSGGEGAKKKYALLDEKENIKIRGFETVRRDWCNLARKMQNDVLEKILEKGNHEEALKYIKEIIKKLKKREIKKEDLIIRTQLKKPISEYKAISPHVVAARKMQEQEIQLSQGKLIEYYIAETNTKSKLVRDKVKLPDEEGEYEIDYYLNKQILPAIENILQVFNVDIKEIVEEKKQMTLGDF